MYITTKLITYTIHICKCVLTSLGAKMFPYMKKWIYGLKNNILTCIHICVKMSQSQGVFQSYFVHLLAMMYRIMYINNALNLQTDSMLSHIQPYDFFFLN